MRVEPSFQGRGFGTQMLEGLEERAKQLGINVLRLDTAAVQGPAVRLYEGHGYQLTHEGLLGPPGQKLKTFFYEKHLS